MLLCVVGKEQKILVHQSKKMKKKKEKEKKRKRKRKKEEEEEEQIDNVQLKIYMNLIIIIQLGHLIVFLQYLNKEILDDIKQSIVENQNLEVLFSIFRELCIFF